LFKKIKAMNNNEDLLKQLEGLENTIWAYKFEFHDIEETERTATIKEFEKKKRVLEAKIKAIDIKKKLQ
tara:strand:- start:171 stop:377 length:207 start_codon:yes stop_codon:yes gene_type:complete